MNKSSRPPFQTKRIPSAPRWAARSALGAMIATSVALALFLVIGIISWVAVRGVQGVGIAAALGAAAGATLRGPGSRLARILGGGIGGVVAGYFAVASSEMVPPGTIKWAYVGGTYASLFGLPVAALVGGIIGLLSTVSRSLSIGNATNTDKNPPT